VAYWRCSAVVHGDEDDDVFYSRTIFKATESVFGLGWAAPGPLLGCCWVVEVVLVLGCCWAARPGELSLFFSLFYFLFLFSVLNLLVEFKFEFCFVLQVLNCFNINII
jgi:hypothetical protein